MKLGRTFAGGPGGARGRRPAGRRLVRRARHHRPASARLPLADVDPDDGAVLLARAAAQPARRAASRCPSRTPDRRRAAPGEVVVVGLGPGGRGLADAGGRRPRSPPPTTWSATARTSTGCRPTRGQRRHPSRQPGRGRAGRARPRAGPARPPGGRRLLRRPGRLRDGRRGARGGRPTRSATDVPVRVRARADRGAGRRRAGSARRSGHDFCVLSLSDRLKPWDVVARPAAAAAAADLVHRDLQPGVEGAPAAARRGARRCCWSTASPDTPVVVGRDVGGPEETVRRDHARRPRPRRRSTCAACC